MYLFFYPLLPPWEEPQEQLCVKPANAKLKDQLDTAKMADPAAGMNMLRVCFAVFNVILYIKLIN